MLIKYVRLVPRIVIVAIQFLVATLAQLNITYIMVVVYQHAQIQHIALMVFVKLVQADVKFAQIMYVQHVLVLICFIITLV